MPIISTFYGLLIFMFFEGGSQHNKPHIHVKFQNEKAVFSIPNGEILDGYLNNKKTKLIQAWIAIHEDELMADWELAVNNINPERIEPLK